MGICNGFGIPVSQMFGAGDYKQLRKYVSGSLWLCIIFGAVITAATVIFCTQILEMTSTPEEFLSVHTFIS